MRYRVLLAIVIVLAAVSIGQSETIKFIGLNGGSLSYDGAGGPLVGSGISVGSVVGVGTPVTDVLNITDGELNFTSGNFTGSAPDHWYFAGGGTITITGGISAAGIPVGTDLISGSFDNAYVQRMSGGTNFKILGASFSDNKVQALLDHYGVTAGNPFDGNFGIFFLVPDGQGTTPPEGFSSFMILDGSVSNDISTGAPVSHMPLPSAGLAGLLGFGVLMRSQTGRQGYDRISRVAA